LGSLIYQFGEAATKLNIENLIDALNTAHAVIMRLHERHFGSFERPFALPEGVGADKVEASFKNGVLKVRLFLMDKF
jgi:HSP20 family molecular chaperone IbpA